MTRRPQTPVTFRCPTCGGCFDVNLTQVMPFCSERCQQIDLGRWLEEEISLPVEPGAEDWDERDDDSKLPR